MSAPIPLTWNEALSGIFGSISLASWIFVMVPQLVENYRLQSADGLSLTFLLIWFVGDVANLIGALWAQLVPTVIAIAVYFCFTDTLLISQCLYYRFLCRRGEKSNGDLSDERAPLLTNHDSTTASRPKRGSLTRRFTDVSSDNVGLPYSRRRSSGAVSTRRISSDTAGVRPRDLPKIVEEPTRTRTVVKNTLAILAIIVLGTAGWAIAWRTGVWRPAPVEEGNPEQGHSAPLGAEILGYVSATLYLGARIPQILKNQRERSCDGLSLLFFMFSLMGNATYGAGILFHSVERSYFITNLPWLIGSLGTIAEDVIVFIQFSVFGERAETAVEDEDDTFHPSTQGRSI